MKRYNMSSHRFAQRRMERKSRNRLIFSLFLSLALIYALLAWILPAIISGLTVVTNFKSPPSAIKSSVADSTTLAPPVFNIPFETTGSAYLIAKGYTSPNSKVEIYLDDHLNTTVSTGDDGSFESEKIELSLGTNNIYGKTIDDKGNSSLNSKPIKLIYANEKPKLQLTSPEDNKVVSEGDKKILVSGKSDPDGVSITVNGIRAIVDNEGYFKQIVDLVDGDNEILVKATNAVGNSTQLTRKVTYQPKNDH